MSMSDEWLFIIKFLEIQDGVLLFQNFRENTFYARKYCVTYKDRVLFFRIPVFLNLGEFVWNRWYVNGLTALFRPVLSRSRHTLWIQVFSTIFDSSLGFFCRLILPFQTFMTSILSRSVHTRWLFNILYSQQIKFQFHISYLISSIIVFCRCKMSQYLCILDRSQFLSFF